MKQVNKISGFESVCDAYYVTREGDVHGVRGKMRPQNNGLNYKFVRLRTKDGKYKSALVHRLVALAFIPNPEDKPQVNHVDVDPSNNHFENLEWVTHQENIDHSLSQAVIGACIKTQKIVRFNSMQEADRNGFRRQCIGLCIRGKLKSHKGYTWARDEDN